MIDQKIKDKIIKEYETGKYKTSEIAKKYGVSVRSIQLWVNKKNNSSLSNKTEHKKRGRPKKLIPEPESESESDSESESFNSADFEDLIHDSNEINNMSHYDNNNDSISESEELDELSELDISDDDIIITPPDELKKEIKQNEPIKQQNIKVKNNVILLPEIDLKQTRTEPIKPFIPKPFVNNIEARHQELIKKYLK